MSDARSIHRRLSTGQRTWADSHALELTGEHALAHWRDNLLVPISSDTEAALASDPPPSGEPEKAGRLHALGSGLALALNAFEPWRARTAALSERMPWLVPADAAIRFAAPVADPPDGGAGRAITADLLIESGQARPTAVIPLFVEPFDDVDPRVSDPRASDRSGWAGLHGCELLARDLHCHPRRYVRLDVGRILESSLALTRRFGRHGFRIAVLWFDAGGRASRRLRIELARVRMRIGGEVELLDARWQDVLDALACADPDCDGYSHELLARYRPETRGLARACGS